MTLIAIFIVFCLIFGNQTTKRKTKDTLWLALGIGLTGFVLLIGLVFGGVLPIALFLAGIWFVSYWTVRGLRAIRV